MSKNSDLSKNGTKVTDTLHEEIQQTVFSLRYEIMSKKQLTF